MFPFDKILSAALVACLQVTSIAAAQTPDVALRATEEQLATALLEDDTAAFDRLLASDFVLRGAPDIDRATWMKNAVDLCWGKSFEISDFAVRAAGADTATVTLILTTQADPVTCAPAIIRSLLTDVWVRRADRWQLALRHSGPAGDAVAQQFAQLDPPPPLLEGQAELSLVATGGNTDTRTLGTGGSLTWRPGKWVTRTRAAYVRSTTASLLTTESLNADLRQSRSLSDRVDIRAGAVYLSDQFAGIDRRITVDGGFGWLVVDASPHTLKLDLGAGATHEARLSSADISFPVGTLDAEYRWRFSRTSVLSEQVVMSTDLRDSSNWRLRNVANMTVSLNALLSFKLAHELRRTNRPVPGFRSNDTLLSAALVARF